MRDVLESLLIGVTVVGVIGGWFAAYETVARWLS